MPLLQNLIVDIRSLRKDRGVPEKQKVPIFLFSSDQARKIIEKNADIIRFLVPVTEISWKADETISVRSGSRVGFAWRLDLAYEATIDVAAERERLTKEIAKYEKGLISAERQLGNEGFLAKAPANVVEGLKKQEAETRLLLEKARAALNALPGV
jgi:valyl-tRNA synthetase